MVDISKEGGERKSFREIINEFLLVFILVFVLLIIGFIGFYLFEGSFFTGDNLPTCGDGTFYDSCSLSKPYYCEQSVLVEKASICGCPLDFSKEGDFCVSEKHTNFSDLSFSYILRGQKDIVDFRVYQGFLEDISTLPKFISYTEDEQPLRSDFKLNKIDNEFQRQALLPLVVRIQNLAPDSKVDQARIAISLVQNIPYQVSDNLLSVGNSKIAISQFPYQTLSEIQGSCEDKSELLAFLLKEIGYGVSLFYYPAENHESVGIKCIGKSDLKDSGYCFVEATSPAILTDSFGEYANGEKLLSDPEIIVIYKGEPLPGNLYEYHDANSYSRMRDSFGINLLTKHKFAKLNEKYGL